MQIVEVKNNLVKISYDTAQENLVLSGFVVINDPSISFISQVIHLEANLEETFAVVKLMFTFDENGVIKAYNGSAPDIKSFVNSIQTSELLELLPVQNPILIGELAQQQTQLNLDISFFEGKLIVCSEKEDDNETLVKNFVSQLLYGNKKILVIDLDNTFSAENKVIAGRDFKLPLNYETINFIYTELDDAKAETKALVQEVFLEVQNYVKTLPEKFIPFETFKNVVDSQYQELNLVELVLLKNKLLKYFEMGLFAQAKSEFDSLKTSLESNEPTILDLSNMDDKSQREMISYAYSLINEMNKGVYVFLKVNNQNSNKKLLKQIFMTKQAYSTLICSYSYKYLQELKQLSSNLVLFAPIQQQTDFAGYNAFLNKLNVQEFVVYGKATHHLPLIVKMDETPQNTFQPHAEQEVQTKIEEPVLDKVDLLDEEIKKDVDKIYTAPKSQEFYEQLEAEEISESTETEEVYTQDFVDELTEDDLDLIDSLSEPDQAEAAQEDFAQIVEEPQAENKFEIIENEEISEPDQEQDLQEHLPEESFADVMNSAPEEDILPVSMASTPIVPIYSADIEPKAKSDEFEQGDIVMHQKYGKGTVEKLITYGSKTLCSIHFDNVGRRLLDPTLAEIKKV